MKKIILILCLFFSLFSSSYAATTLVEDIFSDISSDYKYRDELQALYDRGMIVPDGSGTFGPNKYLNRDEFVGISMEVICERCIAPHTELKFLEKYANKDVYFDINSINPYFYCVAEADDKNYVKGYDISQTCENRTNKFGERPFCPLNRINVEEAIAVLLRNSGIFTIEDNQEIINNIRNNLVTQKLGVDVNPKDIDGNPYTFYGYIEKALNFEITEYTISGNKKILKLLELDSAGNINPKSAVTKEDFLRMSYIALKSNSCSEISDKELALQMHIWEKTCSAGQENCKKSDLKDSEDIYDFTPEVKGFCDAGILNPSGYAWRFINLTNGEEFFHYGIYLDDIKFPSSGEWRISLTVKDNCGNTAQVYSTILVENPNITPQEIDVDIDVYDDDCTGSNKGCREIEFEDESDDGDNIFDFDGDVSTTCKIGEIKYFWTFTYKASGKKFNFTTEFVDDFYFMTPGVWHILLEVEDGCGQTGSEEMTYIVKDDTNQQIDVDIDVYDDDCTGSNKGCREIEFEDESDDGDNIFDFDGDVSTTCKIGEIKYFWTFTYKASGKKFNFTTEFVDDFYFMTPGVWHILLEVEDGCGQTGSEEMTYIVQANEETSLSVTIQADPISGYKNLEVDFESIISGGTGPYRYDWNFGDGGTASGKNPTYLYQTVGIYEVLLTVRDAEGRTGTATVLIQVLDADTCLQDTDNDSIVDCEDSCPYVTGSPENSGCPILETKCTLSCGCKPGYECSDQNPLTCGAGICLPAFNPKTTCLYTPSVGGIFGNTVCNSCPCDIQVDFLADIRKCDLIFPAITSPDASEIYSQGRTWEVQ